MISLMNSYGYWLPILVAGLLIASLSAPIGCLILWQRKSFLGETLAHAALSGVALSFIFKLPPFFGIIAIGFLLTWVLKDSYPKQKLPRDAILAMIAQGGLALGLLLLSQMKGQRIDINTYLFGDLLSVSWVDVAICGGLLMLVGMFILKYFQGILAFIIHEDLARIEGLASSTLSWQLSAGITFSIAVLLPITGVLLLTALMVVPAATARYCSKTPQSMMGLSLLFSIFSILGGIGVSFIFNLPTSPTMVSIGIVLFLVIRLLERIYNEF